MLKKFFFILCLYVLTLGTAVAAPEAAEEDKSLTHAVHHHEEHSKGAQEETKDHLQFGALKIGLDALLRGESTNDFTFTDFTFAPENNDRRTLIRVRPALTFTPVEYLKAHVEGQWYASYNDEDFNKFSLYQGYLEGSLPDVKRVALKAGRQELVYGSAFMLGADSFFDGLSFDALKVTFKPTNALITDLFGGKYTKDNSGGITGELYGIYGTHTLGDQSAVELYGLLDTGGEGLTHEGKDERTYSIGARMTGRLGKLLTYEVEPVFQFGRHIENTSHHDIRAFGGHLDLTIDPAPAAYPGTIFLSYAVGSGDDDFAAGKFTEFHNPNNDTPLIGDMSVIGDLSGVTASDALGNEVHASGLHAITIGGSLDITDKFSISLDGHYFRALETPAGISRDVGVEMNLILAYKITEKVCLLASANRFFTGPFFKDATGNGSDINYGYLQLQATF